MPTVDTRPSGLDELSRPGNQSVFTLTWPTGYLTGRTWLCTVGGLTVTPVIVGDVMTLTVTGAQTTTLGNGRHAIVLTETTGGLTQVRIAGRLLLGSTSTDAPTSTSLTVTTTNSVAVTVSVASGGPGIPAGGSSGQALVKTSGADFAATWVDIGTQIELDAEAAARAAADTAEATARAAADTTLQTNITAEAAARAAADTADAAAWAAAIAGLSGTYVSAVVGADGSVSLYQNGVEL